MFLNTMNIGHFGFSLCKNFVELLSGDMANGKSSHLMPQLALLIICVTNFSN